MCGVRCCAATTTTKTIARYHPSSTVRRRRAARMRLFKTKMRATRTTVMSLRCQAAMQQRVSHAGYIAAFFARLLPVRYSTREIYSDEA